MINLAADEICAGVLLRKNPALVRLLVDYIVDPESSFADTACVILSNLSRGKANSELVFKHFETTDPQPATTTAAEANGEEKQPAQAVPDKTKSKASSDVTFERLLQVFCTETYNKKNSLDYLAPFICNLTQLEKARAKILNDDLVLMRLMPYTTYAKSVIRRGGIVGSIKNCCFNYGWLLKF